MKKTCCAVGVALLAGCGGGSDGGTTPSNDTLQPLSLWQDFVSQDRVWRTLGSVQYRGDPMEVTLALQPKGTASLSVAEPGKAPQTRTYERVDFSSRLTVNEVVYESQQIALYLDPANKTIAHILELGDSFSRCSGYSEGDDSLRPFLPTSASTADSGRIFGTSSYTMQNGVCYLDPNYRTGSWHALNWSYQNIDGRPMFCMEHIYVMAKAFRTTYCLEMSSRSTLGTAAAFTTNTVAFGGGNVAKNY